MSLEQATEIAENLGKDYARDVKRIPGASETTVQTYKRRLIVKLDRELDKLGVPRHGDIRKEAHNKAHMAFYTNIPRYVLERDY